MALNEEDDQQDLPTFPSPFVIHDREPITLVELRMRKLSEMIRQKPRWWMKLQDDSLVAKWREEMIEYDRIAREEAWGEEQEENYALRGCPRDPLTNAQLDYVFAELRYVASELDERTGIHVSTSHILTLLHTMTLVFSGHLYTCSVSVGFPHPR